MTRDGFEALCDFVGNNTASERVAALALRMILLDHATYDREWFDVLKAEFPDMDEDMFVEALMLASKAGAYGVQHGHIQSEH